MDIDGLYKYLKNKQGLYLKTDNGAKVKLDAVTHSENDICVIFTYNNSVLELYVETDSKIMHIPESLYSTSLVKLGSGSSFSHALKTVLNNWVEEIEKDFCLDWVSGDE